MTFRPLGALALVLATPAFAQEPPPPEEPEAPVHIEEEITVSAGHSDRRIQDVPLRVDVVDREEIEEKALMTPGSVAMLLGETTGLRVQRCSSPTRTRARPRRTPGRPGPGSRCLSPPATS